MVAERGADAHSAGVGTPAASPGTTSDSPIDCGTDAERASPDLRISTTQLKALLKAGPVLMLDVRDADSYVAGHLPGAILLPLADLADRLSELRGQNRPTVIYCT
jgi:3-mercaptopyruvate sulfurtransferase SseA